METEVAVGPQAIIGLAIGILVLIYLVLRTKIHAVLALVVAASIAGFSAGMTSEALVTSLTRGFGNTLATIGLVIGFGVMMGKILEVSGAAERLAISLVRTLGRGKEEWAMVATGYISSISIFCDSAFVILSPLSRALARNTGKSALALGFSLAGGMMLTHHAVPPTPGPLGVAGIFGVDVGLMILWGLAITVPVAVVVVLYARWIGPRIEARMAADGTGEPLEPVDVKEAFRSFETAAAEREKHLPGLGISMLPILLPLLLIFANTIAGALFGPAEGETAGPLLQALIFLGNPVIAVGLGVVVAVYGLARHRNQGEVIADLESGVESAGIILLVTGAGGALGAVLRDSGTGDYIGSLVATLPLPAILIPFVIASLVRLIQGSGTVAMITGASISAPIIAQVPDINLVFAAQAAAIGSMVFGYFNDSYFWVVNRMLGVSNARHQLLGWSTLTTVAWASALVMLLILNALFG